MDKKDYRRQITFKWDSKKNKYFFSFPMNNINYNYVVYFDENNNLYTYDIFLNEFLLNDFKITNVSSFVFFNNSLIVQKNDTLQAYNLKNGNIFWSLNINKIINKKNKIIKAESFNNNLYVFFDNGKVSIIQKGEIINIGPDDEFVTINELASTIANLLTFNLNPVYKKGRPQEVFLANCSANKARKLFKYKTKFTLKQGLSEMIAYIKKRGTKSFKYHIDLEIINELTPETWKKKLF